MSDAFNRWAMRVEPMITRAKIVATRIMVLTAAAAVGIAGTCTAVAVMAVIAYGVAWSTGLPVLPVLAALNVLAGISALMHPSAPNTDARGSVWVFSYFVARITTILVRLWAFFYLVSLFVPKV